MEKISHKELKLMFIGAYYKIRENKEEINKINMFPVPDQDTGSNFEKTLAGIYEAIKDKRFDSLKKLNQTIINGALNTACGNVGVIYVSFLSGFLPSLKKELVTKEDLIVAFNNGANKARNAIQDPKEGTILDVIDATARAFKKEARQDSDLINILKKTIDAANKAVKETQQKMELYQKASVVDAGGLGFVISLQGLVDGLENKHETIVVNENQKGEPHRFIQILNNRYEVMTLIKNPKLSRETIKEKLKKLGDCLDIVVANEKIKIHIHTDFPDEVVQILEPVGEILQMTTTDMTKTVGEKPSEKEAIGIVVDGAADLPEKIVKKENISVVPFNVFLDRVKGLNFNKKNIYQTMREIDKRNLKVWPKTSQPSPGKFFQAYKQQLTQFSQIICITFSSSLSGAYNSAVQARELLSDEEKKRVYIIDSLCGTGAQGLLVLKTLKMIKRKSSFDQIISGIKQDRKKVFICAIVDTPKWLERGGRINHSQAVAFDLLLKLKTRPLFGLKNYKIDLVGFRFGFGSAIDLLFTEFKAKTKKPRQENKTISVFLTHNDDQKKAEELKRKINQLGIEVVAITQTTAALGAHIGPGAIICSYTY